MYRVKVMAEIIKTIELKRMKRECRKAADSLRLYRESDPLLCGTSLIILPSPPPTGSSRPKAVSFHSLHSLIHSCGADNLHIIQSCLLCEGK